MCLHTGVHSDTAAPVLYTQVDQPPIFPGGKQAMQSFIDKNKRWPANTDICFEGRILISFLIEENGRPSNIKTATKDANFFDQVNTKLVNSMPTWQPGSVNGKPVRTLMYIPVTYRLTE